MRTRPAFRSMAIGAALLALFVVIPASAAATTIRSPGASSLLRQAEEVRVDESPTDLVDVPAPTISSPPSEAELEDIEVAAEEFDLSIEEAISQFGWRDNFGRLVDQVATSYSDDFARAEIVDGESAWIAFADEQPREIEQLLHQFTSAFPHVTVELRSGVGYTARSMNEAVIAVHRTVMDRPEVLDAVTEYWSADNAILVVVSVDSRNRGADVSANELKVEFSELSEVQKLPESVSIEVSVEQDTQLSTDDSWTHHYGGEKLHYPNPNDYCTSGFGTVSLSGTRGISTAGHCDNSLKDDGRSLYFQAGHDGHWGDFQWHTGAGTEMDDFYSGSSYSHETGWRDVSSVSWAGIGNWLCTNGAKTYKECDRVRNTGVCDGGNCNMFGMTNREQDGGDSGAPVFNGNTAYGLHEGGYVSGGAWRDTKSQAHYMSTAINAYVATS